MSDRPKPKLTSDKASDLIVDVLRGRTSLKAFGEQIGMPTVLACTRAEAMEPITPEEN